MRVRFKNVRLSDIYPTIDKTTKKPTGTVYAEIQGGEDVGKLRVSFQNVDGESLKQLPQLPLIVEADLVFSVFAREGKRENVITVREAKFALDQEAVDAGLAFMKGAAPSK